MGRGQCFELLRFLRERVAQLFLLGTRHAIDVLHLRTQFLNLGGGLVFFAPQESDLLMKFLFRFGGGLELGGGFAGRRLEGLLACGQLLHLLLDI